MPFPREIAPGVSSREESHLRSLLFVNVFVKIPVPSISKPKESDHDRATFRGAPARRICGAFRDTPAHRVLGAFRDMPYSQTGEMPYAQRRHFGAMIAFNY